MEYSYLFLLLPCWCCNAQSPQIPQSRNVFDFKTSTWNTNGQRWREISRLMAQDDLDLMVVQEIGSMRDIRWETTPARMAPTPVAFGCDVAQADIRNTKVSEYAWTLDNEDQPRYYVYYHEFDRFLGQLNLAIITKRRADKIILLPNYYDPNTDRISTTVRNIPGGYHVNRHVFGIQIENALFFNIRAQRSYQNEGQVLIGKVAGFTSYCDAYKNKTWMALGGFTHPPERTDLPLERDNRFFDFRKSDQFTDETHGIQLDYAVVGGPEGFKKSLQEIRAELTALRFKNPSDHKPVRFYRVKVNE